MKKIKNFIKDVYNTLVVVLGHTFTWIIILGAIFGGNITIKLFTEDWIQKVFELFGR